MEVVAVEAAAARALRQSLADHRLAAAGNPHDDEVQGGAAAGDSAWAWRR
jgi:hypothetical protein